MPLYLIERRFADQLQLSPDDLGKIEDVNSELNVKWLYSFLTADKRKTYCLYQASSPDLIREAASRLQLPADAILEVSQVTPAA
jgi:hypothetical protein